MGHQLQLGLDTGLLILIWLVQLIIYPTFHSIAQQCFSTWHRAYVLRISMLAAPLILGQATVEAAQVMAGATAPLRIALLAGAWATTGLFSIPCHAALIRLGQDHPTIDRLITTNWFRTLCWTALFAQTLLSGHTG
jgi:hypothetical protein